MAPVLPLCHICLLLGIVIGPVDPLAINLCFAAICVIPAVLSYWVYQTYNRKLSCLTLACSFSTQPFPLMAARVHDHTRGNRGGGRVRARARARARGRGARGRDMNTVGSANAGMDASDSGLESSRTPDSSESSSDSDSESEAEIPIPRSCQQCPVHVIQGHHEEAIEHERKNPYGL